MSDNVLIVQPPNNTVVITGPSWIASSGGGTTGVLSIAANAGIPRTGAIGLIQGANTTIVDNGDGTFTFASSGGSTSNNVPYISFVSSPIGSSNQTFFDANLIGYNGDPTLATVVVNGVVLTPIASYTISITGFITILDYLDSNSLVHVQAKSASSGGGSGAVSKILAGNNVSISPVSGVGAVTISAGINSGTVTSVTAGTGIGAVVAPSTMPVTGVSITSSGILSLLPPTSSTIGGVKAGTGITIANDGTISSGGGTGTVLAVTAGTGLNISGGSASITTTGTINLSAATTTTLGGIVVGSNLTIDSLTNKLSAVIPTIDAVLGAGNTTTKSISLGSATVSTSPINPNDVVRLADLGAISSGVKPAASVRLTATSSVGTSYSNGTAGVGAIITGTAPLTIDGVTPVANDRVLLIAQAGITGAAAGVSNGIYTVSSNPTTGNFSLIRATDANSAANISAGQLYLTTDGASLAGNSYINNTSGAITVGTTPITFVQFSTSTLPSTTTPLASGSAAVGTSTRYARGDHVHPLSVVVSNTPTAGGSLSLNSSTGVLTYVPSISNSAVFNTITAVWTGANSATKLAYSAFPTVNTDGVTITLTSGVNPGTLPATAIVILNGTLLTNTYSVTGTYPTYTIAVPAADLTSNAIETAATVTVAFVMGSQYSLQANNLTNTQPTAFSTMLTAAYASTSIPYYTNTTSIRYNYGPTVGTITGFNGTITPTGGTAQNATATSGVLAGQPILGGTIAGTATGTGINGAASSTIVLSGTFPAVTTYVPAFYAITSGTSANTPPVFTTSSLQTPGAAVGNLVTLPVATATTDYSWVAVNVPIARVLVVTNFGNVPLIPDVVSTQAIGGLTFNIFGKTSLVVGKSITLLIST